MQLSIGEPRRCDLKALLSMAGIPLTGTDMLVAPPFYIQSSSDRSRSN